MNWWYFPILISLASIAVVVWQSFKANNLNEHMNVLMFGFVLGIVNMVTWIIFAVSSIKGLL